MVLASDGLGGGITGIRIIGPVTRIHTGERMGVTGITEVITTTMEVAIPGSMSIAPPCKLPRAEAIGDPVTGALIIPGQAPLPQENAGRSKMHFLAANVSRRFVSRRFLATVRRCGTLFATSRFLEDGVR